MTALVTVSSKNSYHYHFLEGEDPWPGTRDRRPCGHAPDPVEMKGFSRCEPMAASALVSTRPTPREGRAFPGQSLDFRLDSGQPCQRAASFATPCLWLVVEVSIGFSNKFLASALYSAFSGLLPSDWYRLTQSSGSPLTQICEGTVVHFPDRQRSGLEAGKNFERDDKKGLTYQIRSGIRGAGTVRFPASHWLAKPSPAEMELANALNRTAGFAPSLLLFLILPILFPAISFSKPIGKYAGEAACRRRHKSDQRTYDHTIHARPFNEENARTPLVYFSNLPSLTEHAWRHVP